MTVASSGRLGSLMRSAAQSFRPVSAMLELTHRCHLACVHCYLEDNKSWSDKGRELTTAEVCLVLDQLRQAGCMFVTITGGEAFLRPDLFEILRHARQLGLAVTLFTTGTLLEPQHADQLSQLHVRGVELALYSTDPQVHDAVTKRVGSHSRTMRALELLLERQVPVSIKCPLMRSNFDSYPGLKALAERLGIALAVDSTVTPMNDGARQPTHERPSIDQLAAFYARPEFRDSGRVQRLLPDAGESICTIGKRSCVIGPFGDVYTCLGFKRSLGNLRLQRFSDIWQDSGLLHQLRRTQVADVKVCAGCEKFSYCNRCAGMALSEDGSFDGPSRWSCHLAAAKE
jgi:radical SAM protein with 4Fe4S-binding SPASM domain